MIWFDEKTCLTYTHYFMALFSAHCASYYPWPPETKNFSKQDGKNNSLSQSEEYKYLYPVLS